MRENLAGCVGRSRLRNGHESFHFVRNGLESFLFTNLYVPVPAYGSESRLSSLREVLWFKGLGLRT